MNKSRKTKKIDGMPTTGINESLIEQDSDDDEPDLNEEESSILKEFEKND